MQANQRFKTFETYNLSANWFTIYLEQWFSTGAVLPFTPGNLETWRHFWLSQIGDSTWLVDAGNTGDHRQWPGLSPYQRIIWIKMPIVLRLRSPHLEEAVLLQREAHCCTWGGRRPWRQCPFSLRCWSSQLSWIDPRQNQRSFWGMDPFLHLRYISRVPLVFLKDWHLGDFNFFKLPTP